MDYYNLPAGTTFLITLKAIVIKDGKALVLKSTDLASNKATPWELPGGLIEINEEPKEAVKREVLEETGMTVTVNRPIEVHSADYEKFTVKNGTVYKVRLIVITFLCSWISGDLKLSSEHSEGKFFTPEETKTLAISASNFPGIEGFQENAL